MVSDQQTPLHLCCAWGLMNVIQVIIAIEKKHETYNHIESDGL